MKGYELLVLGYAGLLNDSFPYLHSFLITLRVAYASCDVIYRSVITVWTAITSRCISPRLDTTLLLHFITLHNTGDILRIPDLRTRLNTFVLVSTETGGVRPRNIR